MLEIGLLPLRMSHAFSEIYAELFFVRWVEKSFFVFFDPIWKCSLI